MIRKNTYVLAIVWKILVAKICEGIISIGRHVMLYSELKHTIKQKLKTSLQLHGNIVM